MASQPSNPNYRHATTQTKWQGLTKHAAVRPEALLSPPTDTSTPPDDSMLTEKPQFLVDLPAIVHSQPDQDVSPEAAPSLLERRRNPVGLVTRITMPVDSPLNDDQVVPAGELEVSNDELEATNEEVVPSPPPTHVLLSPVPAANKLHAGHTPLFPRSFSPVRTPDENKPMGKRMFSQHHQLIVQQREEQQREQQQQQRQQQQQQHQQQQPDESQASTPDDEDVGLTGPLMLPVNPMDGAEDNIGLEALDYELAKIAREREGSDDEDSTEPSNAGTANSPSTAAKAAAGSHRSAEDQPVDGVILKSPQLNFGAPLGQMRFS